MERALHLAQAAYAFREPIRKALTLENPLSAGASIGLGVGVCAVAAAVGTIIDYYRTPPPCVGAAVPGEAPQPCSPTEQQQYQAALAERGLGYHLLQGTMTGLPLVGLVGIGTALLSPDYRTAGIAAAIIGLGVPAALFGIVALGSVAPCRGASTGA